MPIVIDILLATIVVASAVWGYRQGLSTTVFAVAGLAAGGVLGSRLAPLLLSGGIEDDLAPVVALPAALLGGALVGTAAERLAFAMRVHVRRPTAFDPIGGAAVATCVGVVAVWVLGATAAQIDSLQDQTSDSEIVSRLSSALPPPGPLLEPIKPRVDPLPLIEGPRADVGPANPVIKRDPQVRSASGSVLKVLSTGCGGGGSGSGWIGADGVVVTNAHVVQGSDEVEVQVGGTGATHAAEPIWYDDVNDIALLRAPGVRGVRALPLDLKAKPGTIAAVLGFPGGGDYTVKPARLGSTARVPGRRVGREYIRRPVTSLRAGVRPGNSGGPAVDGRGRVVTMVFAGRRGGHSAYGVPLSFVEEALRRAGPRVGTGSCLD